MADKKYVNYRSIAEYYGGKGFFKVKPDALSIEKVLIEFVQFGENKSAKDSTSIFLDVDYALTLCNLIDNGVVYSIVYKGDKASPFLDAFNGIKTDCFYDQLEGFKTPIGGTEKTKNGVPISRWIQIQKPTKDSLEKGNSFCITSHQYPATVKKGDDGRTLYVPKSKEGAIRVYVPITMIDLYNLSSAIKNAINLFNTKGLSAFIVDDKSASNEDLPVNTPEEKKATEKPASEQKKGEEISPKSFDDGDIPAPNFNDEDSEEPEIKTTPSSVKTLALKLYGLEVKKGEIVLKSKFADDNKDAKPLSILEKPVEGSPLFKMLTFISKNGEARVYVKVKEEASKYVFVNLPTVAQ